MTERPDRPARRRRASGTEAPDAAQDSTWAQDDWMSRLAPFAWYTRQRPLYCGGNEVELLRGGQALFPAMCEAFSAARHHIWLTTYLVHDDPTARQIVDALIEAAARGVRVRVVVDGFGSGRSVNWLQQSLTPAGVAFVQFRPVRSWLSVFQPEQMRRLHHKLCVVDGEVGFVGGINIIDDHLDVRHGPDDTPRLDYAVRVRGAVVASIEQTARADWTRAWLGRDWRDEIVDVARSAHPLAKARRTLRQLSHRAGDQDWTLMNQAMQDRSPIRAAFVVRDNFRQRRTIERAYIAAIAKARQRVVLVVPYFYPGRLFRHALRDAAQRGVAVQLLLQGKVDYRVAAIAARALYDEMLSQGVRIFEYKAAYLHAKVAVVDDSWATVGSSNIDPLSLLVNLEANVIVRDAAFTKVLSAEIDAALAQSDEILPRQGGRWWGRSWWGRLRGGFVAGCARLYLRVAGATGKY